MTFMHMDALTAASAEGGIVQLLNQNCTSTLTTVAMGLRETGKMNCFDGSPSGTFPWNWIDPLSEAPGDPSFQVRRINLVGDTPIFGPVDGLWSPISIRVISVTVILNAGSGYSVNDTLTFTGGIFSRPATFNVDSIGGGGSVTAVSLVDFGSYSNFTTPPVSGSATTVSPPGGTGFTGNVLSAILFNWVLSGTIAFPSSASFDVQLRKGTGQTLRTARWGMTTVGGIIP